MRLSALSIRARALLLLAVVAVPYVSLQAYAGVKAYRSTLRMAEDRVIGVAAATASALEQFLSVADRSTGSLAERLGPTLLGPEGCGTSMAPLREAFPFFANVLVVDAAGTLVCSAKDVPEGLRVSAAERDWFREVRDQRRFAVGRPVIGPVTEGWVVAAGSPILAADGTFLGAVAGTVELLRLEELLEGRAPRANELVTITTAEGVVVARSVDAERWVGRPLPSGTVEVERRGPREFVTRTDDASGLARIWGRVDLPEFGLRVYVGVPTDRITGPTLAALRTEALVSLAALLSGLLLAIVLFRGISQSVTQLVDGVRSAAAGSTVPIPPGAPPEVTAVVTQLNRTLEERRRAEESERRARERLHDLVENAVFGICVAAPDGRFLQVNRAFVEMLGYASAQDLLQARPEEVYHDPSAPARLVEAAGEGGRIEDHEIELRTRDGRPVVVRLNGQLEARPDGTRRFELIVEDITEQRALESLTRHQQKMEAVGRLAGGVAHDFNNLLTVLGVNSELIRSSLGEGHPLAGEIEEVEGALGRARALTRKLLAFSRKEVNQPRLLDVNQVLVGLEGMLRRVLGETVTLTTDLARSAGRVWIDPGHLEQVVLNLVLNARDALGPEGGSIVVSTATRAAPLSGDDDAQPHGPVRWYTVLTVSDDGPGMDGALQNLVFEPFFTTKPPGVGTGLGLPTVYGIVTEVGGRVRLASVPGEGASFDLWLPVADDDVDGGGRGDGNDDPVQADGDPFRGDGEQVLLVLEDPFLRAMARDALEGAGYAVLEAGTAAGALDVFWRHNGPLHVVVAEPDLPPVSGVPLIDRLRQERAKLPLLVISDRLPEAAGPLGGVVAPPFGPRRLGAAVRAVLDATPGPRPRSPTAGDRRAP